MPMKNSKVKLIKPKDKEKEKQKVKLVIDTLTGTNWELAEPRLVLLLSLAVRLVIIHSNWYGQSCNAIEVAPSKWAEPSCETVYRATSARASKPSGAEQ